MTMKRAIFTIMLVAAATVTATAQINEGIPQPADETRVVRIEEENISPERLEMRNIVLGILRDELKMTDEQFEKFAPVYIEYRQNIRAGQIRKPATADIDSATDDEINSILAVNLDNYIHISMVRKVYIPIFEKILTPKQVYGLYEIDNSLSRQARDELMKRRKRH